METLQSYKSFTDDKSIEELQFNILTDITSLENLKFELQFYKLLLDKPIFKPHEINLYETLVKFKNEIQALNENCTNLLNDLSSDAKLIGKKIECEDLACDHFFIKEHDAIKHKIFNFKEKIFIFKFRLFQFIESVINN
ncbi:hypothetical protein [uncultured Algibacter sp.]|uniref:hypothetical protein n=1 Tax=uncultured Algibacter sp. TaxID=298659 RepID=UPI0030EF9E77|tara:strand:- start:918 stop:1334 length:417 start_codon:yes stop_codon:yes gene_type:complete